MQSNENGFYHRRNPNGTYASICCNCFLATGSCETEGDTDALEKEHLCDQIQVLKRDAFRAQFTRPDVRIIWDQNHRDLDP